MKGRKSLSFYMVVLALLCVVASSAFAAYSQSGPKAKEILFPIYMDDEAILLALLRGDVDIYPGLTQPADIKKLRANKNIDLTMNMGYHMFYVALNTGKYPTSEKAFRQAFAHLVDRDKIILNLFEGYMLPLDSLVPQSSNYYYDGIKKYEYDLKKAAQILDEAGFKMGPNGVRIDPKTGKDLEKIEFLTPLYEVAPTSAELGKMLAQEANKVGIPMVATPLDFNVILDKIDSFDYQLYALAWSLSREPDHLYSFFHSSNAIEAGQNTTQTKVPEIDKALEDLLYATNREDFAKAANRSQELLAEHVPYVTLYSRPYIDAFRTDKVKGYVPMSGYGAAQYQNLWTTLNIESIDGDDTVRWVLPQEPKTFNLCTAKSAYDWDVLGRVMDNAFAYDPETVADMPNWVTEYQEGTWEYKDPETGKVVSNAAVTTYKMRKDVKWHDGTPFTAKDVKFSLEYLRDNQVPRYLSTTKEIVKVETPDDYTVVFYASTPGFLHVYDIQGLPLLKPEIWKDVKDWQAFQPWLEAHPTVEGLTKLVGIGPYVFKEYRVGEYVRLERFDDYWRLKL
ncbi:MAG TPA: hypothetical protein GX522_05870 [Firmicutes bacterium]|nr:hypothetical protein [Bacillota bacterium]